MNTEINQIRQLLCQTDTPALRTQVCALCVKPWMMEMAEHHIPGLGTWSKRQLKIVESLELHRRRNDKGANYSERRFRMKDLAKADLRGAYLREANLRYANLRESDLSWANLIHADLTRANLRGSSLEGADLRGGGLYRADLREADLSGAELKLAILTGAKYDEHTQFPEGFDPQKAGMVKE